jgi:hypothetical protein
MSASAADLCNCCGEAVAGPCASACQTVETTPGQCIPIVDFDGKAEIGPGKNALYEFSLRNLRVSKTDDHSLERFRRLLERLRRAAEADRKLGLRDRRRGKIDDAGAAALAARYDGAIVNYYLGAQAYRLAKHN